MAKLYIMNGPNKGQFFELKDDAIYIGRSPDNDIQMNDLTDSRKHLKILTKANKYFIEDLKSKNGTFVNGKQIDSGKEFEVKEGVPIAIGGTRYIPGGSRCGGCYTSNHNPERLCCIVASSPPAATDRGYG